LVNTRGPYREDGESIGGWSLADANGPVSSIEPE
jgi:hypothetical protein